MGGLTSVTVLEAVTLFKCFLSIVFSLPCSIRRLHVIRDVAGHMLWHRTGRITHAPVGVSVESLLNYADAYKRRLKVQSGTCFLFIQTACCSVH